MAGNMGILRRAARRSDLIRDPYYKLTIVLLAGLRGHVRPLRLKVRISLRVMPGFSPGWRSKKNRLFAALGFVVVMAGQSFPEPIQTVSFYARTVTKSRCRRRGMGPWSGLLRVAETYRGSNEAGGDRSAGWSHGHCGRRRAGCGTLGPARPSRRLPFALLKGWS